MRLEKYPVFRKIIVPWYDSETLCFILTFLMFLVFLFSVEGILVAGEKTEYLGYVWVPILLVVMSGTVIISITIRLVRRYFKRFSE
jgi:hypothetical protein